MALLSRRGMIGLLSGVLAVSGWAAAEANWPQWRGPTGTGVAPAGNPPAQLAHDKNLKWRVKLPGVGSSTPVIWDKFVFVQTAVPTGKNAAADAGRPQVFAQQQRPQRRPGGGGGRGGFGGGAAPTEVHQFVLMCLDRDTGNVLWQKPVREEVPHEGHHRDHGFSSYSPLTDGKHV